MERTKLKGRKLSSYAEEYKDAPDTCDEVQKWLEKNKPKGPYTKLIECFQNNGESGEEDDRLFYKWLKKNYKTCVALKPLRDKNDFEDFVFRFGKIEPCYNQKWHFYVSVLAYKECVSKDENIRKKSIVKQFSVDDKGNYFYQMPPKYPCDELDIWIKKYSVKNDEIRN